MNNDATVNAVLQAVNAEREQHDNPELIRALLDCCGALRWHVMQGRGVAMAAEYVRRVELALSENRGSGRVHLNCYRAAPLMRDVLMRVGALHPDSDGNVCVGGPLRQSVDMAITEACFK